jgi:RNA polymerase sigma-70 factor (ECF subfamily)
MILRRRVPFSRPPCLLHQKGKQANEGQRAVAAIWGRLRSFQETHAGDEPDAALVARAQRDRDAFASLYLRYVEEIARFCFVRLRDEEAARDATQQIFARAFAGLPRYQETGQFRAWLYTIARHVLANDARGRQVTYALETIAETADAGPSLEERAASMLDRQALLAAVSHLPDDQRTAVELRLAGLTGPEVAAAMARSHDAVKKLQLRALERLRAELTPSFATEEAPHGAR